MKGNLTRDDMVNMLVAVSPATVTPQQQKQIQGNAVKCLNAYNLADEPSGKAAALNYYHSLLLKSQKAVAEALEKVVAEKERLGVADE